jgi:hypothetical protein
MLFGGQFDPVAMNLNMLGLDEVAIYFSPDVTSTPVAS